MSNWSLYPFGSPRPEPHSVQTSADEPLPQMPVCPRSPSLQEKRMSKATEVMMQYVENLKRTYEKDHAELMEFKKLANQNSSRSCSPSGKEPESCPPLGPAMWVPDVSRLGLHLTGLPQNPFQIEQGSLPLPNAAHKGFAAAVPKGPNMSGLKATVTQ